MSFDVKEGLLNWMKSHQVLVGLLLVGFLMPLAVIYGFNPLSDSLHRTGNDLQTSAPIDSVETLVPGEIPTLKARKQNPFWSLSIQEGNEAELMIFPGDHRIRRVEITRAGTKSSWHIQVSKKPLIVQGHEWYSLRFRARADDLREIGVAVSQDHAPWKDLGFYRTVAVMKQWQDYEWEFVMGADDNQARVHFDVGGWDASVEIGDVRLVKLSHGTPIWRLNLGKGSEARLEVLQGYPEGVRVAITKAPLSNPYYDIQLVQNGIKLQAGDRYRLRFDSRAQAQRDIQVAVSQAHNPWEDLGLYQRTALTSEWQQIELEFVAKSTDDNARIHFDLGGQNIPVDIKAVQLLKYSEMLIQPGDSSLPSVSGGPITPDATESS